MHVDDSACNLASLNLMKFRREDGSFDVEDFEHAVDIVFLAQEIVVGFSSYPTEEITENANAFRQLGLGYANLGALLMSDGLPYDSDAGRNVAAAITALMTGRAYRQSALIAAGATGPYDEYEKNRDAHNGVMRMHRDASYDVDATGIKGELLEAAQRSWDEAVELGEEHGYRNAQATVLAPTGTISFLMDCDTTGIEPDFSLVKFKELVGGGQMTIINRSVPLALRTLGYAEPQVEQINAYITENSTIVGAPGLKDEHLPVFDVAVGERAITHTGHIDMMAATQPFISGAISKTVNLPQTATIEDIADAYTRGWKGGLKALAIYRDGSKTAQALRTDAQEEKGAEARSSCCRRSASGCRASASRSPTSSRSPATRATSPPASTRTAPSARSSSPTSARRARRCAGCSTPSPRRSRSASSTACRSKTSCASSATCASSRRASPATRRSPSPSRCPTTSCAGSAAASSRTPTRSRTSASSPRRCAPSAMPRRPSSASASTPAAAPPARPTAAMEASGKSKPGLRGLHRNAAGASRPRCPASTSAPPASSAAA